MKRIAASFLFLLFAPFAARAQATATVHIYRIGSHSTAIKVMIDGHEAFELGTHEIVTFSLSPGHHEIAVQYAERRPTVAIEAHAGDEDFFQLTMEARKNGLFGIGDPSNAVAVDLTKEGGIADAGKLHERKLSPEQLDRIASLHMANALQDHAPAVGQLPPEPPLTDEEVQDAILEGKRSENPGSIGLYLNDRLRFASRALADGEYASSGFSVKIYTPDKWIAYLAANAQQMMRPFTIADVAPEMRSRVLRVIALPAVPNHRGDGMSAASSVARVVLSDRSQRNIIQPIAEASGTVELDPALRSKNYEKLATAFDLREVSRLRSLDPKGEFFVIVIGDDASRKVFDVKQKFAAWLGPL